MLVIVKVVPSHHRLLELLELFPKCVSRRPILLLVLHALLSDVNKELSVNVVNFQVVGELNMVLHVNLRIHLLLYDEANFALVVVLELTHRIVF